MYKSGRLRIAVNTANLLDFDWWNIENVGQSKLSRDAKLNNTQHPQMSWVQDFPPVSTSSEPVTTPLGTKFAYTIESMLIQMNAEAGTKSLVDSGLISSNDHRIKDILARYDFSRVRVGLAASRPGNHTGVELQRVGHTGLMRVLRSIGARCPPEKQLSLECQVCVIINS